MILIACSYIYTLVREDVDRVRERYGAKTFAEWRVQLAENAVVTASTLAARSVWHATESGDPSVSDDSLLLRKEMPHD